MAAGGGGVYAGPRLRSGDLRRGITAGTEDVIRAMYASILEKKVMRG